MAATPKAGYYDDGSGRQRWWDGSAWTDQYSETTGHLDPGVLWQAVGRPITGIGAGRYKLTADILFFERGALSTRAQQIATHEIHDVDASQTMTQKARSVGTISLTAMRTTGNERVLLEDIADFRTGVQRINEAAHAARDSLRTKQQTQHVNYSGGSPVMQAAAPAAVASAPDFATELARLVSFKEQGMLSDDEFTAAKAKLLGI